MLPIFAQARRPHPSTMKYPSYDYSSSTTAASISRSYTTPTRRMRLLRDVLVAAVIATSLIYLLLPTRLSNSIQKTTTTPPPHASVLDSFGPNQAPPASPVSYNNDALLQPSPPDRNLGLLSMLVKDAIANNAAATSVAVNVSTIVPKTDIKRREKAVIVILCRNSDLKDMRKTMRNFEDRFNRNYNYPYVFFNNEPFTDHFKRLITAQTSAPVEFHTLAPSYSWGEYPDWINQTTAEASMRDLESRDIIYGGNLNYHHMCRWYSGFFYNHPALADYEWYWRVEPGVTFFCDVPYDPFVHMAENKKEYGFTISLVEIPETIPSLWKTTMEFAHSRNLSSVVVNNTRSSSSSSSLFNFFTDDGGATYNGCHFWSNFEIARFDLYRSDLYEAFFDHLDKSGGFFYERWGDAPVHSLYTGLVLQKDQVHFFNDIGYQHEHLVHCADTFDTQLESTCQCPKKPKNFDFQGGSCLTKFLTR